MADILREVAGLFTKRWRDMGDGTHADVVAIGNMPLPPGAATEATLAALYARVARDSTLGALYDRVARESTLAALLAQAANLSNLDMAISELVDEIKGGDDYADPATLADLALELQSIEGLLASSASEVTAAAILSALNNAAGLRVRVSEPGLPEQTPTITAGAYSAKDAVGGKLTFTDMGNRGHITSLVIIDNASQAAELVLNLFDRDFTAIADNSAYDPSDADQAHCLGHIRIIASDYQLNANNGQATLQGLWLPYKCYGEATTLYGQLMCVGTPTYAASTDLTVKLGRDKV